MTEQTYIEKIEEMRKKGTCRTSPASARIYAAQLRAGSPLCLAAAADGICESGESLLDLHGKEAFDRLNRWQAEKSMTDKERAALKLLLKIHSVEPISKRSAFGVTTLKPFHKRRQSTAFISVRWAWVNAALLLLLILNVFFYHCQAVFTYRCNEVAV